MKIEVLEVLDIPSDAGVRSGVNELWMGFFFNADDPEVQPLEYFQGLGPEVSENYECKIVDLFDHECTDEEMADNGGYRFEFWFTFPAKKKGA